MPGLPVAHTGHDVMLAASLLLKRRRIHSLPVILMNYMLPSQKLIVMLSLIAALMGVSPAWAQQTNPLAADPRAPYAGGVIFRAQCATCHGPDAKGIASIDAPDLTLMWSSRELADIDVFTAIRNGIPGSIMPAHDFPDPQVWMLVAYLRSIAVTGTTRTLIGDAEVGRELFAANCATCHRVAGTGGSLGPDLTRIMARREVAALVESIRNPGIEIGNRYRPVLITAADGQLLQGTIKSEDAFSLQIMDMNQQLRGVTKDSVQSIERPTQSLMPRFTSNVLSDADIENILTYLQVQQ